MGGFPCQPFSSATHGVKTAEDLWPLMANVIEKKLPKYWIAENVQEKPIREAERFAKKHGYRTTVKRIGANEAGADHRRNRWWLIAHPHNESEFHSALNAEVAKLQEFCSGLWGAENYARAVRVLDGLPDRMDRLKSLGNTVMPWIPLVIGRAILAMNNPTQETLNNKENHSEGDRA